MRRLLGDTAPAEGRPLLRLLAALLMRAGLARILAPWVGKLALAGQPDQITLAPMDGEPWRSEPVSAALERYARVERPAVRSAQR